MLVLDDSESEVLLNGAFGEGGGQILRSAVSLAALTKRSLRIIRIRAGRKEPGLRAQHATAVRAVATLCGGSLSGADVGSSELRFTPGAGARAGGYSFRINTAGSAPLLLQTVIPVLAQAEGAADQGSQVEVHGGTHLPHAPSSGYLAEVYARAADHCGLPLGVATVRPGFYPAGGGLLRAEISALPRDLPPIALLQRDLQAPLRVRARAGLSRARGSIGARLIARVAARLAEAGVAFDADRDGEIIDYGETSRSSAVFLELFLETAPLPAGFVVLGERGVLAERIADRAVHLLLSHLQTEAAVDPHLADQLLLLLALSRRSARLRTSEVTEHLTTHAALIAALLPLDVRVTGALGQPGEVSLQAQGGAASRHFTSGWEEV